MKEIKSFKDLVSQFKLEEYIKMFAIAISLTIIIVLVTGVGTLLFIVLFIALFSVQFYINLVRQENSNEKINSVIMKDDNPNSNDTNSQIEILELNKDDKDKI